jgi:hypothetical protein
MGFEEAKDLVSLHRSPPPPPSRCELPPRKPKPRIPSAIVEQILCDDAGLPPFLPRLS